MGMTGRSDGVSPGSVDFAQIDAGRTMLMQSERPENSEEPCVSTVYVPGR